MSVIEGKSKYVKQAKIITSLESSQAGNLQREKKIATSFSGQCKIIHLISTFNTNATAVDLHVSGMETQN